MQRYLPVTIIDAVGTGDALADAVTNGWLDCKFNAGLQMGVVLAAMALGHVGDMVVVTNFALDILLEKGQCEKSS